MFTLLFLPPPFSPLLAHPLFTVSPVPFIHPSIYLFAHTYTRIRARTYPSLSLFFLSTLYLSLSLFRSRSRTRHLGAAPRRRRPSSTPHPHQPHVALSASPWSYENYVTRSIRAFLVPLSFLIFLLWISRSAPLAPLASATSPFLSPALYRSSEHYFGSASRPASGLREGARDGDKERKRDRVSCMTRAPGSGRRIVGGNRLSIRDVNRSCVRSPRETRRRRLPESAAASRDSLEQTRTDSSLAIPTRSSHVRAPLRAAESSRNLDWSRGANVKR